MSPERRRFFRIADTIGLAFRVVKPQVPHLRLSTEAMEDGEVLKMLDTELGSLINSLWETDVKYARAIGLLNQKMDLLVGKNRQSEEEILEQYDFFSPELDVNLSAAGIAFTCDARVELKDRVEVLLLLMPSRFRLTVFGSVVNVAETERDGKPANFICIEFDLEAQDEESLIQHIVQRQVESMSRKKTAI
jgi:hypothetical protein